jgi:DNA-binding transcriptional regulator LsrR (DeoR family)
MSSWSSTERIVSASSTHDVPKVFRKIPSKIGIAGGTRKADAVVGAIRGGYINILITDSECAKRLYEMSQHVVE